MSLGFEQAGFDVVAAVELDPVNAATHEFNFPFCPVLCADATAVTGAQILRAARLQPGELDVVFGGPPCQGFSVMGKRSSKDPRNRNLQHFHRLLDELQPRYLVVENVPGLASLGTHLKQFISKCRDSGYYILEPIVLDAASFGVPQQRRRLFLFGYRRGVRAPKHPEPTHVSRGATKNGSNGNLLPLGPSVMDAIGDLPDVDRIRSLIGSDSVRQKLTGGGSYARAMRNELCDDLDFAHPREYDSLLLTCSQRIEHTEACRKRFGNTEPGRVEPRSRLMRLSPDGVAHTLRAGTLPDRGSFMSPRPIHPTSPRCITVREAARLHSFPDWFRFHMTKWHGLRQIGNSVPPLLARAVAASVMSALGHTPTKPRNVVPIGNNWKVSIAFSKGAVGIRSARPSKTK